MQLEMEAQRATGRRNARPFDRTAGAGLSTTGGRLIYAVGDIHGRLDLLQALVLDILADAVERNPGARPLLVFLGDYVDRGFDSAGVLDLVIELKADAALEVRTLKGNHEETFLEFLQEPSVGPLWAKFGGDATMASYGVDCPRPNAHPDDWIKAQQALIKALPKSHVQFLRSLELMLVAGDYVFVHAGLRPGAGCETQSSHDVLWIRDEFLTSRAPFEKVVVHGHSPSAEPELLPHRLGIDTGAYATGVLTALRLEGEARSLLQTSVQPEPRV